MNILNRRRQMGDKGLPYDAQIEYLESTGKQYIDTGILAKLTNSYKIDCEVVNLDNNRKIICGSYIGQGDKSLAVEFGGTSNQKPGILRGWVQQGNVNVNLWTAQALLLNTNINVYWEWDPNTKKLKIEASDGQTSINDTSDILNVTLSDATSQTFWLFKDHRTSSTNVIEYPLRIKHLKLYENDILVRDFIPVRKDTTGYMYDKVSGQLFGNSGTGNFTLGQDIVPIEYLEKSSNSNARIDLGTTANAVFEITAQATTTFTASMILIGRNTSGGGGTWFGVPPNVNGCWGLTSNSGGYSNVSSLNKTDITVNFTNSLVVGTIGSSTFSRARGGGNSNWFLFSTSNNGYPFIGRVYALKVYINNVFTMDLVPYRIGNIGYLYDKISKTFFTNAGTDSFILGPDKT